MSKAPIFSRRLGFGVSAPPPIAGTTSADPFHPRPSPFIPLFSPMKLPRPIQTAFDDPISQFSFAIPLGTTFVGQAIANLDAYQQQVTYSKTTRVVKEFKRKEKESTKPAHPHLQTHFSEEKESLFFATSFPKVNKPKSEMRPGDYDLHAIGANLLNATMSDKVEMMEETSKAISSDFIKKSHRLEKMQVENAKLQESLTHQRKEDKALRVKINRL